MKTIKIIDLFYKIANGKEVPNKIKWRDETWKYDDRIQDYTNKHLMLFEQLKMIRTKELLTDEVEILDEEDEFEDIEEITYKPRKVQNVINQLIKNQKKIIERLKDEK